MNNHKSNPKVAVCLAAFNGKLWVGQQIDSILEQRNVDITLYISVDLSNDGTEKIVEDYSTKDSRVFCLEHGHKFGNPAKNFFRLINDIDFSNFDYISFSDQDDLWLPNKLNHAIHEINKRKISGYSSDVIAFWHNGKKKIVKKSYPQKKFDFYFEAAGPGCTYVLVKKSILKFKIFLKNNFDKVNEIERHDWLIYAYFRRNNMKWFIDDKTFVYYRQHNSNVVGFNYGLKAYYSRFILIINNWYFNEIQKIVLILEGDFKKLKNFQCKFMIFESLSFRRKFSDAIVLLIFVIFGKFKTKNKKN